MWRAARGTGSGTCSRRPSGGPSQFSSWPTRSSGGFAVDYWILRRAGEDRDGAIARVLALGALEYTVLAPAALVSAIFLALSATEHVSDALTLPWLGVITDRVFNFWLPMVPAVAVLPTIAELRAEYAGAERQADRERDGLGRR